MTIKNDGKVGIGDTGPDATLVTKGAGISDVAFAIKHAWGSSTTALMTASNGSGEVMRLQRDGKVGIGTSAPSSTLSVVNTTGDVALLESASIYGAVVELKATGTNGRSFKLQSTASGDGPNPSGALIIDDVTGGARRLVIDALGNVGIGNSNPGYALDVQSGDTTAGLGYALRLRENTTAGAATIQFTDSAVTTQRATITVDSSSNIRIGNSSERVRIDSSGRLLCGTSSTSSEATVLLQGNNNGSTLDGTLRFARGTSSPAADSSLGKLDFGDSGHTSAARIQCLRDGGTWTSGSSQPTKLTLSTTSDGSSSPTQRMKINRNGDVNFYNLTQLYPETDNTVSLGLSGFRWSAVWAANGTIQTSDQRTKTQITDAALGSDFIKSLRPVSYRWIEGGKRDTGERDEDGNYIYESVPGTRTHWGFIAQEVKQVVDAAGVDFGGWVLTDKDDPDSQQALRYDQFIAPLTKALQETMAELEALKAEVAALKGA